MAQENNNQSEIRYLNPVSVDVKKKKYCRFKKLGIKYVDYKDGEFLKKFLNEQGKILPRRLTGTSQKFQKKVAQAVKRARHLAILPFVTDCKKKLRGGENKEVILIKDIENLGYANDIVNVKPGYANNYLIPQGYAKAATAPAKKILAENLKQRAHKDAKILADAQALAEKIANLPLVIAAKAEEGRIVGAITAADLAEALAAKGIEIDRKTIAVENIKTLGEYEAVAKIHRDVKATIKFTVTAEE